MEIACVYACGYVCGYACGHVELTPIPHVATWLFLNV